MSHRWSPWWLLLMLAGGAAFATEYTVSVEPGYSDQQAHAVYQPLLEYLGKATGHRFALRSPADYPSLWGDIRANMPVDFVFEEAPFVDYRAQHFGFEPLARTAEPASYSLIASPEVAERGVAALVGYRVMSMPAPSLGHALLREIYRDPAGQPEVWSAIERWQDGVEMVLAGEADAAMVPTHVARRYPNLVEMQRSRALPGRAWSAAGAVPDNVKTAVRDALLEINQHPSLHDTLTQIGATRFEPANADQYRGHQQTLSGVSGFGE